MFVNSGLLLLVCVSVWIVDESKVLALYWEAVWRLERRRFEIPRRSLLV